MVGGREFVPVGPGLSNVPPDLTSPRIRLAGGGAPANLPAMEIRQRGAQKPFTTKDGSTITSLLDLANAPVRNQSLAEALVPAGTSIRRHYHRLSEEFYYILHGSGVMEVNGTEKEIGPGDAILIPAGAWHTVSAGDDLRFLCCCSPPYNHNDTYFE